MKHFLFGTWILCVSAYAIVVACGHKEKEVVIKDPSCGGYQCTECECTAGEDCFCKACKEPLQSPSPSPIPMPSGHDDGAGDDGGGCDGGPCKPPN